MTSRRSAEELGLERGAEVYASFKATAVHVLEK
ncbi:MAG: TOBE domain-containing protein [Methanosarcinales archaeon]